MTPNSVVALPRWLAAILVIATAACAGTTAPRPAATAPAAEARFPLLPITDVYQSRRRMTLTYPALAAARNILWLVTGADKREALANLRAGDHSIPAGRVPSENAVLVCDRAATGD